MSNDLWATVSDTLSKIKDRKKISPWDLDSRKQDLEELKTIGVLTEWSSQQTADRRLRAWFGAGILIALVFQLGFLDYIIAVNQSNDVIINAKSLPYWLSALVIEVIGLVTIIAKGLFKNTVGDFHNLVSYLFYKEKDKDKEEK